MSYSVSGTTISLTRGDTLRLQVSIMKNGVRYMPEVGDEVRFALKHRTMTKDGDEYTDVEPLIYKVIPSDTMILQLNPEDTKSLSFGKYVYDIQITFSDGVVYTFITNAKFNLGPEVD